MTKIVVFGAGGRAGRHAVAEARRRGHQVTAVVRDPAAHTELAAEGVQVIAGDVTSAAHVAVAAAGADAAVNAAADLSANARQFFPASAEALAQGLAEAGVARLVAVGLSTVLPTAGGTPLMDDPDFAPEHRPFFLGHAAGLDALRKSGLDWIYLAPAGDFDHDGPRTGRYTVTDHIDMSNKITYQDFAIALIDQIDTPTHHHTPLTVT